MLQKLLDRLTGRVLFEAEIEADAGTPEGVRLGLAVKAAFKAKAYLGGADLRGAGLRGADLRGVDLRGADLRGTDLRGANLGRAYLGGTDLRGANLGRAYLGGADLRGANLRGAYLGRAYLGGADLGGADLRGADLRGTDLRGADLGEADLGGADLGGADLGGADLRGADLRGTGLRGARWDDGVKWRGGVLVTREPIVLSLPDLPYCIAILDRHVQIGCRLLEIEAWAAFGEADIGRMDGKRGVRFWRQWRDPLLAIAKAAGRPLPTPAEREKVA